MKILIAADMEGITGDTHWDEVNPKNPEYTRLRELMAGEQEGRMRAGHFKGRNILIEKLNPPATLTSGTPSYLSMVNEVDENVDGAIFIGYHGRMGTTNVILDTSGRMKEFLEYGSASWGECGLNGAVGGHFNVPVIMIPGTKHYVQR